MPQFTSEKPKTWTVNVQFTVFLFPDENRLSVAEMIREEVKSWDLPEGSKVKIIDDAGNEWFQ